MKTYHVRTAEQIQTSIAAAIADGTHSASCKHVCEGCREWVDSIYYITFTGTRLCPSCADLVGQGPKADAARRGVH